MEQRNSGAANTRLRHTDWHALWSSSYACAWCTPFRKGTFPLVNPLRGNIPLAGAHFRALLARVTVLLYGAKPWQLLLGQGTLVHELPKQLLAQGRELVLCELKLADHGLT